MQDVPLLKCCAQGAVQPILEVELALPFDDMREQIPEKRRVLVEEGGQVKGALGCHELVETDLVWRQLGPVAHRQPVVGIRTRIADTLEDHSGEFRRGPSELGPWTSPGQALCETSGGD
jgi:hypothetical protein